MTERLENLENLEKEFIIDGDMEQEDIQQLISRILKFCKIDKNGYVMIYDKNLKLIDRILLILSARYLGNRLQQKLNREITINDQVSNREISNMLREKDLVVNARLKDLKDERKVIPVKRGVYKIAPHIIDQFLSELEEGTKNE